MNFPDTFFDDEVRDGFFVSGQMKRCWASQLEVLSDFDELCKRHDLNWFSYSGTLLGAVRHGGYIPWDDDIDVVMLRRDYDKFLEYAEKELTDSYMLINQQNNIGIYLTIYCTRMIVRYKGDITGPLEKFHGFPLHSGIDIFPLEDFTDDKQEETEFLDKYYTLRDCAREALSTNSDRSADEHEKMIRYIELKAGKQFDRDNLGFEIEQFMDSIHRNTFNNPKSKKVVSFQSVYNGYNAFYKRNIFDDWMLMPFENMTVRVPVRYREFLAATYGPNYMEPVRGSADHIYPYYKKQIDFGLAPFLAQVWHPYEFWMPDLERIDRSVRDDAKGKSLQFTELLLKIHMMTQRYIELGDITNIGKLLTSCQTVGQNIEQLLSSTYGNDFHPLELVRTYRGELGEITEDYLHRIIRDKSLDFDKLNRIIVDLADELKQIREKRQVVFIPYKASQWPAMESIWKAAEEDPDCDAYVIPIPYYRKDNLVRAGEQIYEGDLFPSYVPVVDYNTYDFEHRHPDVIYMVSAYDEISCSDCVYPFFYGFNIKKFTDKLIYVPPFEIEEIKEDDKIAIAAIEQYVKSPGFVNADYILTQSDNIKERYLSILKEFSGEVFEAYWENKLLPLGTALHDIPAPEMSTLSLYNKWKEYLKNKRVILFQSAADALFLHPKKELQRIEKILETFRNKTDKVTLVWMPQPEISDYLDKLPDKLKLSYLDLINVYKESFPGVFLDGEDSAKDDEILAICDAYYGNPSPLSHKFMMAGRPVMLFK